MLSQPNHSHEPSLSAASAPRHGQLSNWFGGRVHHGFGSELGRYDARFALDVAGTVGRFYGPGRYFDLSTRGLDRVPSSPVMFVSNHSGGTTIPDVWGFGVAWYRHFGTSRPLHVLAHELLFAVPALARFFERVGVLRASLETARKILEKGRDLLIFPGGASRPGARTRSATRSTSAVASASPGWRSRPGCRSPPWPTRAPTRRCGC